MLPGVESYDFRYSKGNHSENGGGLPGQRWCNLVVM
jgi:hypothetical protein